MEPWMGWMERRKRQLNILNWGQMPTKEPALTEEMNPFPEDVSCNTLLLNERWLNGSQTLTLPQQHNMERIVSFSTCSPPRSESETTTLSCPAWFSDSLTGPRLGPQKMKPVKLISKTLVGGTRCQLHLERWAVKHAGKRCQRCFFILWLP